MGPKVKIFLLILILTIFKSITATDEDLLYSLQLAYTWAIVATVCFLIIFILLLVVCLLFIISVYYRNKQSALRKIILEKTESPARMEVIEPDC